MTDLQTNRNEYCILLCAHNGASYVADQLASIAAQDIPPTQLIFFDDGSSDDTLDIAQKFAGILPISFVQLTKRRPGAAGAFDAILNYAVVESKPYANYLLCDQDDIWEPFKARRLLERLAGIPPGKPALVHSELKCFGDEAANRDFLHQSLGHLSCESTPARPLQSLLFENVVVGASAAFNRTLLERATPMALAAFMHDWWLAIACVAHGGEIIFIRDALTRYRIHGNSTVGRSGNFLHALPRRFKALRNGLADPWLRAVIDQLKALPFGDIDLPQDPFEPLLSHGRTLLASNSFQRRSRAWFRLRQQKIWAVSSKDAYYKTRLLTDHVIRHISA